MTMIFHIKMASFIWYDHHASMGPQKWLIQLYGCERLFENYFCDGILISDVFSRTVISVSVNAIISFISVYFTSSVGKACY